MPKKMITFHIFSIMRRFYFCIAVLLSWFWCSCTRSADRESVAEDTIDVSVQYVSPLAVLQAGEFPLWFQFAAEKPVLIESIDDACFSAALVPWPLAPHVRFMLAQGETLMMAINRDGLICFMPWQAGRNGTEKLGIGFYRFSGGEFWQQYTVGAFVMFDEKPAALLYRDDRFFDSGASLPSPRLWTFDLYSPELKALAIPSLDTFAPESGWDTDTLRPGGDGFWYFRMVKKTANKPELLMLRSSDLVQEGEKVSLGVFQNAALPQPLSAAPSPLQEILAAVFAKTGCGIATVVSPEFQTACSFATNREKAAISGFYASRQGNPFLLAVSPQGNALYAETGVIRHFSLPPLPEDFVYTGIGLCGDTVIASWEEQNEYNIGAAGFMVIRLIV